MTKWLVFDISNVLYRTFFANKGEDDITVAGLAAMGAMNTLNSYFHKVRPDRIVMAFDRKSWRKAYTGMDECISKRPYKGNRHQKMTPVEKVKYEKFLKHLADFELLITDHTKIITLAGEALEADDLISGFVQYITLEPDNEVAIVSGDKDMIQLLGYEGVTLINPDKGGKNQRTLDDWGGDAELFLFEKCLRGDIGDNVMSAAPRVRKTEIDKAYVDEFVRTNLMNREWVGLEDRKFKVGEVFAENQLLMDLRKQPEYIQRHIIKTVIAALQKERKFSYFHFLKFLGKLELTELAMQADQYVNMLSL